MCGNVYVCGFVSVIVLVICVFVLTVLCSPCTVFLYCLVYVYLLLFVCLYQCKDKCHGVTTQMLLIIIIIITITEFDHSAFLCALCTFSCSILTVNLVGVYNDTEN